MRKQVFVTKCCVFVGVPIMALTATAVPKVQRDIVSSLGMIRPLVSKATFDRPNLAISIQRKGQGMAKSLEKVVSTLKTRPTESTIIYCATTREVEEVAETIRMHLRDTKVVVLRFDRYSWISPFCHFCGERFRGWSNQGVDTKLFD